MSKPSVWKSPYTAQQPIAEYRLEFVCGLSSLASPSNLDLRPEYANIEKDFVKM